MERQGLVNVPMRMPQADLTSQQANALEKSRQDLELSKLKGEAKERARLGYAADELGLKDEPQFKTNRDLYINQGLAKWKMMNPINPPGKRQKAKRLKRLKRQKTFTSALLNSSKNKLPGKPEYRTG
jgi:hypothetical protein